MSSHNGRGVSLIRMRVRVGVHRVKPLVARTHPGTVVRLFPDQNFALIGGDKTSSVAPFPEALPEVVHFHVYHPAIDPPIPVTSAAGSETVGEHRRYDRIGMTR